MHYRVFYRDSEIVIGEIEQSRFEVTNDKVIEFRRPEGAFYTFFIELNISLYDVTSTKLNRTEGKVFFLPYYNLADEFANLYNGQRSGSYLQRMVFLDKDEEHPTFAHYKSANRSLSDLTEKEIRDMVCERFTWLENYILEQVGSPRE